MFADILFAAGGVVAGLLIGINNPTLAASAKKAVLAGETAFNNAVTAVKAKL